MKAIFYDKKNKREVSSDELMPTNVVRTIVGADDQFFRDEDSRFPIEEVIGNLCYKTEECPSYQNWDKFLMETDLVFLRLEDTK